MLLRFQKAAVRGNYETGNQAFSMHLRFLTIRGFAAPNRFTVTKSVQKGRGISLSRRDLPVMSALVAIRQPQANREENCWITSAHDVRLTPLY
jgi:hypothetical protein